MKIIFFVLAILFTLQITGFAQEYNEWEDEGVDEFYEKISVKSGTLDEDGDEISFILVPKEMKQGVYKVELTDYEGDLYEIKGTDYFIKFRGYYGYAGYGEEGVLVVGTSAFQSTFYKKP